ncbi:MAG: HigA family addiction module antitoxin [Pseudomonadota bacterium]
MATDDTIPAFEPPHPGEYIREDILPALDMTIAQLAAHLGVTRQTLSNLINEKRAVSTEMAIRLGKAFGNGARFWLALQMQRDIWERQLKDQPDVKPLNWDTEAA